MSEVVAIIKFKPTTTPADNLLSILEEETWEKKILILIAYPDHHLTSHRIKSSYHEIFWHEVFYLLPSSCMINHCHKYYSFSIEVRTERERENKGRAKSGINE